MENDTIQLPPAVDLSIRIPSEDLLRRILLILQIVETKVRIIETNVRIARLLLLVALTLLALLGM